MTDERRSPRKTTVTLAVATAALAAVIFIADTATLLDIAVATLYVVVVLIAARFCKPRSVVLVGLGCGGLTVLMWARQPRALPLCGFGGRRAQPMALQGAGRPRAAGRLH